MPTILHANQSVSIRSGHEWGDLRVIELRELTALQGRNFIAMGFLVESWTWDGSGLPGNRLDPVEKET